MLPLAIPLLMLLCCLFKLKPAHLKHFKTLEMLFLPSTVLPCRWKDQHRKTVLLTNHPMNCDCWRLLWLKQWGGGLFGEARTRSNSASCWQKLQDVKYIKGLTEKNSWKFCNLLSISPPKNQIEFSGDAHATCLQWHLVTLTVHSERYCRDDGHVISVLAAYYRARGGCANLHQYQH